MHCPSSGTTPRTMPTGVAYSGRMRLRDERLWMLLAFVVAVAGAILVFSEAGGVVRAHVVRVVRR